MRRGATLVELLAAMVISAVVVVLASRIFISGNHQYLARVMESDRLSDLYRLKGAVAYALQSEIETCDRGKLWLRQGGESVDLQVALKSRFPNLESADFRCLEPDRDRVSLTEWKDGTQPRLVEYRLILNDNQVRDSLKGSLIKP